MRLYIDIGELGWSLYLYGYLCYQQIHKEDRDFSVITLKDRVTIYENLGCDVQTVDDHFQIKYDLSKQDGFGIYGVSDRELRNYFDNYIKHYLNKDCHISPEFRFSCNRFFEGKLRYRKFNIAKEHERYGNQRRILIFPRRRDSHHHSFRNIPSSFYTHLINQISIHYREHLITAVGTINGAYSSLDNNTVSNFENLVGKTESIQDVIDLCAHSDVALGGTSSLPKLSLLQGVPTFVFGHEKKRFTVDDNWVNTKVGFYELDKDDYQSFEYADACYQALSFIGEAIHV